MAGMAGYDRSMSLIKHLPLVFLLALVACSEPAGRAAPVGDYAVLEQLATAYREVSQNLPVSPSGMPPEGKRQFVEQVFAKAGYDYGASLQVLSQEIDITNKDHRDLAELLLLPQKGLAESELEKLFSADELAAVKAIKQALR